MKYDKLAFQERIEGFVLQSGLSWKDYEQAFLLDNSKTYVLYEDLKRDGHSFYYKGLLSLAQGILDVEKRLYSWATVKFYYSNFYFMRASLCIKREGFFRKERELYHITVSPNQVFKKFKDSSDHRATIGHFKSLYGNNGLDQIQTNTIDNKNPYEWFLEQREVINYKHKVFPEPDVNEYWEDIHEYVKKNKLEKLLYDYLNDSTYLYCFQEEHALIALPIKRMQETKQDFIRHGITEFLEKDKKKFLYSILKVGNEISKKIIE